MKILCTLPNASTLISGIKFEQVPEGMLSEDVSDDVANGFIDITGYELFEEKKGTDKAAKKAEADAKKAADDAAKKAEADAKKAADDAAKKAESDKAPAN